MLNHNVAFIGSVGVPNNYGGFEMFLDSCAPEMAQHLQHVYITCDKSKYTDRNPYWKNLRRIFIPIKANGIYSILHDVIAFFLVFWRVDVIVVLGVSAGIFFPLMRLFCILFGKKLIVNVDGLEWRRDKFSKSKKIFLYISDRLAQAFANKVIVDNEALRPFLIKAIRNSAEYIPYPGDHIQRIQRTQSLGGDDLRCLTICRIEPENNCHILLEAFKIAGKGQYIFVGNWDASEYGKNLRRNYSEVDGLIMRDAVYDKEVLALLRENCTLYLHGHNVGGTNPSLVEMLFYDARIFAFDCSFNRCTAGNAIEYFVDLNSLVRMITHFYDDFRSQNRNDVRKLYTRANIAASYLRVMS